MLMRKHWKWFVIALVALLVAARFAFSTVYVQLHEVQPGPLAAEVMGTGTLECACQNHHQRALDVFDRSLEMEDRQLRPDH